MSSFKFTPEALKHCLSGFPPAGPNAFEWRDGKLHYMQSTPDPGSSWDKEADPSQSEWQSFWKECDRIGVWNLPEDFSRPKSVDGLQVRMVLAHNGNSIRSVGQCWGAPQEVEDTVRAFHFALQLLVGYHPTSHMNMQPRSRRKPSSQP